MPPNKNLPSIQWAANDRTFTFLLIGVLNNYPLLRQNIWPAIGDKVQGKKKSQTFQSVAELVLEGKEEYMKAFRTPEGRKAYGTSVKNQILQMKKKWREAKKMLGVTGAGLDHKTEIWEDKRGDNLQNVWHEVKKFCPYYYALKPLLGERLVVTDHAITNSIDAIDTSSLLRSCSKVVAPIDAESEEDKNGETGLQAHHVNSVPVVPLIGSSALVTPPVGLSASVAPLAGPSTPVAPPAGNSAPIAAPAGLSAPNAPLAGLDNPLPGSGLRRKNGGYADFAENVRGITEAATSQKRQRDSEKQELRRYKIQKRFEKDDRQSKRSQEAKKQHFQRTHELEMRRLDLQE